MSEESGQQQAVPVSFPEQNLRTWGLGVTTPRLLRSGATSCSCSGPAPSGWVPGPLGGLPLPTPPSHCAAQPASSPQLLMPCLPQGITPTTPSSHAVALAEVFTPGSGSLVCLLCEGSARSLDSCHICDATNVASLGFEGPCFLTTWIFP